MKKLFVVVFTSLPLLLEAFSAIYRLPPYFIDRRAADLQQVCICPPILNRVCGEDGADYHSLCEAKCAGTTAACAGECPCPAPEEVFSGCSEYCTPLLGPTPLEPLPSECDGDGDFDDDDEDAFVQNACDRIRKMGLFRYCYEVCAFEHGVQAFQVFGRK